MSCSAGSAQMPCAALANALQALQRQVAQQDGHLSHTGEKTIKWCGALMQAQQLPAGGLPALKTGAWKLALYTI